MTVKLTGKEVKEFWEDRSFWGEGYYEDAEITVNGKPHDDSDQDVTACADSDIIAITGGFVGNNDKYDDLEKMARAWLKARDTASIVIEFPKAKRDAIVAAAKAAGGKVVA